MLDSSVYFTFSGSCEKSVTTFVLGCDEMLENPFSLASLSSVVVCNQAYSSHFYNIQLSIREGEHPVKC